MVFTPACSMTNHTNSGILAVMSRSGKKPAEFPNNLRYLRERKGWTQEFAAKAAGMAQQTYQRYEAGERRMKTDQLPIFAHLFGVSPSEIIDNVLGRRLPIIGFVGAGAQVFPIDELPQWDHHFVVNCPTEFSPDDTEALIVEGDSMLPIEPRSVVFISKSRPLAAEEMIGKLCVVELTNGQRLLKQVRRGYTASKFNLISTNAAPIEDVKIVKAARVRGISHPDSLYRED